MLRITEVRVIPTGQDTLRATASITLNDCFVIKGLRIIEDGRGRLFVAMPNRRRKDGGWRDIAHPITIGFRKELERVVLDKYNRVLATGPREPSTPPPEPED